ncbi:putative ubiquitin-activating enzyme subunit [Papiliotrema laurentii]|uniref:NEDD8-activating enzyme E1 regulatory subunit n=1 Tax=Papiliotrema laurentii TaxID=5418 RepID=A0AAD9L6Y4_PAPLA|nr:putative ubiquitin-activating enzyme subunit [Papiliotrema laurentii]
MPSPRSHPSSSPHSDKTRPPKLARMEDSIDITQATVRIDPGSYRPDAKTRRYDRQLRLWASAGQRSLEQARVLLVGCDAPGTQTLKNLVLPGISHFTVLSGGITTPRDVATNFFLHPESVGQSIAESVVKYLKELNPSVEGAARVDDPAKILATDPSYFSSFTLIICTNIDPSVELRIADLLWDMSSTTGGPDIPLISIRNSGFMGRISIQLREHCVVDTHPDSTHTLRIDQPFPALEAYARDLDLDSMDSMEHSHIPFVVLLVRAASQWKDKHGGKLPVYEQKDEFKAFLNAGRRKGDEENYQEAEEKAFLVINTSEIPPNLQALLDEDSVKTISSNSKNLHILLHALREYLKTHPLPPISPSLPDMHSSTTAYITLQNLYKEQHRADLAEYKAILTGILNGVGLPADVIPDDEIENFVRNSSAVAIIKGRPLRGSKEGGPSLKEAMDEHLFAEWSDKNLAVGEHLAFFASEQFYAAKGRWPGSGTSADVSADEQSLLDIVQPVIGCDPALVPEEVTMSIAEVVRGGFGSLPSTAAFIGGLVAQEAIKLVTNQYMPLDNTLIVDLIKSTTAVLKL